jgi:hypothetical protein
MTRNGWSISTSRVVDHDSGTLCQIYYHGIITNDGNGCAPCALPSALFITSSRGVETTTTIHLTALSKQQLMRDFRALIPGR